MDEARNLKCPENGESPQIIAPVVKAPILAPLQNPDKIKNNKIIIEINNLLLRS